MSKKRIAQQLGDLTFYLLARCQEKEAWLAEKYGLRQSEFRCLRLLQSDESLSNRQIAKRMKLSQSRSTRIIDGLIKKGFIKREANKKDRRYMKITLFRRGKTLTKKLDKDYVDIHSKILRDINISQHKALISAMENLYSATEKWLQRSK